MVHMYLWLVLSELLGVFLNLFGGDGLKLNLLINSHDQYLCSSFTSNDKAKFLL